MISQMRGLKAIMRSLRSNSVEECLCQRQIFRKFLMKVAYSVAKSTQDRSNVLICLTSTLSRRSSRGV